MGTEDADGRAVALYQRYIGEPDREIDVYAGFTLFFGGIALGALGLAVFLWSTTLPAANPRFWQLREVAIVLAAVGLPGLLGSVVVLLPVSRRVLAAAGIGGAICLVAVGVFVWAYPGDWNVTGTPDYSVQGIGVYAGGLAVLVGATGSALVAHHIERTVPSADRTEGTTADTAADTAGTSVTDGTETVTDEQVERDIEAAQSATDISWGGVEQSPSTKRLNIDTPEMDESETPNLEGTANTERSEGVDDAVADLRDLRTGGPTEEATSGGVDEQTAALRDLRERQEAEEEQKTPAARLKEWFSG